MGVFHRRKVRHDRRHHAWGNGYIGRNVIERWHAAEPSAEFIVVSRKQDGTPQLPNVRWVAGNGVIDWASEHSRAQ